MRASYPCLRADGAGGDARLHGTHVRPECLERRSIRLASGANDDVQWRMVPKHRQELDSNQLAKPSLEAVAVDGGMRVTRHHDPHAGNGERGSESSDIEMHGPNSLPLSNDSLDV